MGFFSCSRTYKLQAVKAKVQLLVKAPVNVKVILSTGLVFQFVLLQDVVPHVFVDHMEHLKNYTGYKLGECSQFSHTSGVEKLGVDGKRNILIMLSAVSLSAVTYEYKIY